MTELECAVVREWMPDFATGLRVPPGREAMDAHLSSCGECRAERDLVRALRASRREPPAGLARRVVRAVRADRARPWWGLTAAAVAALALGIGIASDRAGSDAEVPGFAYEVDEGVVWGSEDGLMAGAPLLDELSDEALQQLLDELTVGSAGGAA